MTELQIFNSEQFGRIRAVEMGGVGKHRLVTLL